MLILTPHILKNLKQKSYLDFYNKINIILEYKYVY